MIELVKAPSFSEVVAATGPELAKERFHYGFSEREISLQRFFLFFFYCGLCPITAVVTLADKRLADGPFQRI